MEKKKKSQWRHREEKHQLRLEKGREWLVAAQRLRFFVLTGEGKGVEGAAAGKQGKRRERKKRAVGAGKRTGKDLIRWRKPRRK